MNYLVYRILICGFAFSLSPNFATARTLVTPGTVSKFGAATTTFRLKNNIPVIFRHVSGSDIVEVAVAANFGRRDMATSEVGVESLLMSSMTLGSKKYKKKDVFALAEKHSLGLSCSSSLETSLCTLSTVKEDFDVAIDLFASLLLGPSFVEDDIRLKQTQLLASIKNIQSDPENISADRAEQIYFPDSHPYKSTIALLMKGISGASRSDLIRLHKQFINAERLSVFVASSLPERDVLKQLNNFFGDLSSTRLERPNVPEVAKASSIDSALISEVRDIPTSYLTIQFAAPGARDADSDGFSFLTRVLNETLFEEVRVKKSLSYATSAHYTAAGIGFTTITSSTSKPKETLEVIGKVLRGFMDSELTKAELDEQRTVYATSFFLTQESHASLLRSLVGAYIWQGDPLKAYEFPRRISAITPRDLKALANRWFRNMRMSFVGSKIQWQDDWGKSFINSFVEKKPNKKKKK